MYIKDDICYKLVKIVQTKKQYKSLFYIITHPQIIPPTHVTNSQKRINNSIATKYKPASHMSFNQSRNQPIPFTPVPMEEEGNSHPPSSLNNFPSNSEFNYPQLQSAASINYNEDPNPNQLPSQKEIIQQEQAEELQKVSLQRNEIDQDEILRMFQEEENRIERNKKSNEKKKPYSHLGHSHNEKKDKKSSTHHHHQVTKKQPISGEDLSSKRKQTQREQQAFTYMFKSTSIKQLKSQPQSTSVYLTILNSEGIRQLLLQYKIQYRSSVYDPEWQKERYKLRESFFEQLCIGLEEMRLKPQSQLSKQQQEVLDKIKQISAQVIRTPYDFGIFKYSRNLVIELDLQLFTHFHLKSKQPLSKDYKAQYKSLLTNLKDPQNYELRQKILCRKMDAEMLKVANQVELLTEMKRNEIREKEQKLLKEFSVEHGMMIKDEGEQRGEGERAGEAGEGYGGKVVIGSQQYTTSENQQQFKAHESLESLQNNNNQVQDNQWFSLSSLLAVNKYIEESTLTQLEELLSDGQMQRMRTRLDEDLKGQCRNRMLKRFDSLVLSKV